MISFFNKKNENELIEISELVYIEAARCECLLHFYNHKDECVTSPLGTITEPLPKNQFVRVHRSYVINLSYVKTYDKQAIKLTTDQTIPIGKTYTKNFYDKIYEMHSRKATIMLKVNNG